MGCGVSKASDAPATSALVTLDKDGASSAESSSGHRALGKMRSSVKRDGASVKEGPALLQMGSKQVRNSFSIGKQRSVVRRTSDCGAYDAGASMVDGGSAPAAGLNFAKLKANMSKRIGNSLVDDAAALISHEGTGTRVRRTSFVLPIDVTLDDNVMIQPRATRRTFGLQVDTTPGHDAILEGFEAVRADEFSLHAASLSRGEGRALADSVAYFRKLTMGKGCESLYKLRTESIVPGLVKQLSNDSLSIQVEAAWALTNVCSGGAGEVTNAMSCGVVEAFVKLLDNCNAVLLEQVLWGLGNVASEVTVASPQLKTLEVVSSVIKAATSPATNGGHVVRNAAWLIANVARTSSLQQEVQSQLLPFLRSVAISGSDEEAKAHAAWAIAYMMADPDSSSSVRFAVTQMRDLLRALVTWVSGSSGPTPAPAVRLLHHLAGGGEAEAQAVLDTGGVPALLQCARQAAFHISIRSEAVTTLTRIALRGSAEVDALLQAGAFEGFIALLHLRSAPSEFTRRCVVALSAPWMPVVSLAEGPAHALLDLGVIQELCSRWDSDEAVGTILAAIEGVGNALRKGQRLMMLKGQAGAAGRSGGQGGGTGGEGGLGEGQVMCNPVALVVSEPLNIAALIMMNHHTDAQVASKAQALLNMLQFMA